MTRIDRRTFLKAAAGAGYTIRQPVRPEILKGIPRRLLIRDTQLIYRIPGLPAMPTTNVIGLPEIRPGQNIPLSNDEWFPWVEKVMNHRHQVWEETNDHWKGRDDARRREVQRVLRDERYWFYTYPGIYEARAEEPPDVVYATEEEAAVGQGRARFLPYILYPFQDYWITWQKQALRTAGPKGDTLTIKSRDMGMSNTGVGMLAYRWMTRPVFQGRVLSRVEELVDDTADPDSMFWKLDAMLRTTPAWMLSHFVPGFDWATHRRHMMLEHPLNYNTIKGESTNATAGRGRRAMIIMMDEFPFMRNFKSVWEATRATTYHRMAIGSVSTQISMDAYNLYRSGRPAILEMDSRTGMHPKQDRAWHDLERSRSDAKSYEQEVGLDWLADAGDFVYPDFMRKKLGEYPYVPFGGPVFGTIDDGAHWAVWFLQYIQATGRIRVLDCYRNSHKPTRFYGALFNGLKLGEYRYGEHEEAVISLVHAAPIAHWCGDHHGANWEQGTGMSVIDDLALNWNLSVNVNWEKRTYFDRYSDLVDLIPYFDFNDTPRVADGLRSLQMYKYRSTPEGREVGREQREPLHNDDSHPVTSMEFFAGLFEGLKPVFAGIDFQWVGQPGF